MVTKALKDLREKVLICKGLAPLSEMAAATGLSRQALARFLRGEDVSLATIDRIEQWVEEALLVSKKGTHSHG